VPHRRDPEGPSTNPTEEAIGANDDLPVRKVRELGQAPTRFWKALESAQDLLGAPEEAASSTRVVAVDACARGEERCPTRRREANAHLYS